MTYESSDGPHNDHLASCHSDCWSVATLLARLTIAAG